MHLPDAEARGCNLDEMKNPDLYAYKNLSEFFYRELKDGVRPIADAPLVNMNKWIYILSLLTMGS